LAGVFLVDVVKQLVMNERKPVTSQKLSTLLKMVSNDLSENQIPYALIGALALSLYGLPRFTTDIDLLTAEDCWPLISPVMGKLGYSCYQKTRSFAQFDSESGVLGRIDFMFVATREGKDILKRSVTVKDEFMGEHPVVQPTDYVILKLMAIANNPERTARDEGDIIEVLKLYRGGFVPDIFEPLDRDRLYHFAGRFGQRDRVQFLFDRICSDVSEQGEFDL
jgi:hypothetical protein